MNDQKNTIEADLPVDFLTAYGSRLYTAVAVLGEMSAAGDVESIRNTAELFRLMLNAAMAVAQEVKKKQAADFKPGWVLN